MYATSRYRQDQKCGQLQVAVVPCGVRASTVVGGAYISTLFRTPGPSCAEVRFLSAIPPPYPFPFSSLPTSALLARCYLALR